MSRISCEVIRLSVARWTRSIQPVHLQDNSFGGACYWSELFDFARRANRLLDTGKIGDRCAERILEALEHLDTVLGVGLPEELGRRRTRGGLGAGFRILVPGSEMTRLDLGWSPEGGFQFHFAAWSKPTAQRARLR